MGTVEHIFVAPRRGAPMVALREVEAVAAGGLDGDRYLDPAMRRSPDYQVTLIEAENIDAFVDATRLPLSPDMPRRNIVTRHVRLNALVGRRFRVGPVTLEGLELCEPCGLLARRTYPEALAFFVGRGGLRPAVRHPQPPNRPPRADRR